MDDNKFFALFAAVLLAALLLRFYDITNRPMHHDEGVIGWFKENILNACLAPDLTPYGYASFERACGAYEDCMQRIASLPHDSPIYNDSVNACRVQADNFNCGLGHPLGAVARYAASCGAAYNYHPDYHGPFEYLFGAWVFRFFGMSDFTLRAPECLFNLLTIALILPLRKKLGDAGSLTAGALLAVSPSMVYYAQRAYMDNFFIFFTLGFIVCAAKFWEEGRNAWLYLGAADLALLFTTKETAFIFAFMAVVFAGFEILYASVSGRAGRFAEFGKALDGKRKEIVIALALFAVVYAFVFSTMFADVAYELFNGGLLSDIGGAVDFGSPDTLYSNQYDDVWSGLGGGLTFWLSRSTSWEGHFKPVFYYVGLLAGYEQAVFALFALVLACAPLAWFLYPKLKLFEGRASFFRWCAWWAVSTIAIFSYIPYKTPWLDIHFILPMAFVAGLGVDEAWKRLAGVWRAALAGAVFLLLCLSAFTAWEITYVKYADGDVGLVYVSGLDSYKALVERVVSESKRFNGTDTEMSSVATDYWPLPWSLRDYHRIAWYGSSIPNQTTPIIFSSINDSSEIREDLRSAYYPPGRYEMRPGAVVYLYVRR